MSAPVPRSRRWLLAAPAAALFALLYLLPLGWRPLLLPDEFRYAEIPREMLASGDWVVPHFNGLLYFEKPVLGYWLVAASEAVLGRSPFAVRLPSALAVGLTALLLAYVVRRTGGRESAAAAWLAALVYLSSLLTAVSGTSAVLDAPLTLFLSGTLVAFFLATASRPSSRRERGFLLLSGAACGLAFLTKGFLALALPTLVAGTYLAWQRRWRDLLRMPWLPIAGAAAVAAPWSLAIHLRAPGFWPFFFWHEHVQRFFQVNAEQHPQPWWFFLAVTPVVLLPWTPFVPAALAGHRAAAPPPAERDLRRFCLAWTAMAYLFYSLSTGKLLLYILPAFPALAILLALGLAARGAPPRGWRAGGLGGAGLLAAAGLGVVVALGRAGADSVFRPDASSWSLAAALALGSILFGLAARSARGGRGPALAAFVLLPALISLAVAPPERYVESKAPGAFLSEQRPRVAPGVIVLADQNVVRAVSWVLERDDVVLLGDRGELAYGVEQEPSGGRAVELAEARDWIEARRGRVVLFAERRRYERWREQLPDPVSEVSQGPRGFIFVTY